MTLLLSLIIIVRINDRGSRGLLFRIEVCLVWLYLSITPPPPFFFFLRLINSIIQLVSKIALNWHSLCACHVYLVALGSCHRLHVLLKNIIALCQNSTVFTVVEGKCRVIMPSGH